MGPSGLGGARAHIPPPPRLHHWDGAPRMGGKGTKKGGGAPRRGEGGLSTVFNLMGLKNCNILLLVFTFTTHYRCRNLHWFQQFEVCIRIQYRKKSLKKKMKNGKNLKSCIFNWGPDLSLSSCYSCVFVFLFNMRFNDAILGDIRPSDPWFNRFIIFIHRLNHSSVDQLVLFIRSKVE